MVSNTRHGSKADILIEWVSGDINTVAQWEFKTTDNLSYHRVWKKNQGLFQEHDDQAEWGNWVCSVLRAVLTMFLYAQYYTTDKTDSLTIQSGFADDVRNQFKNNGKLPNSQDTKFRAISDKWPAFGYAIELGEVGVKSKSTTFSIGLCQQDAIQFLGEGGLKRLPSLWRSYFDSEIAAVSLTFVLCIFNPRLTLNSYHSSTRTSVRPLSLQKTLTIRSPQILRPLPATSTTS